MEPNPIPTTRHAPWTLIFTTLLICACLVALLSLTGTRRLEAQATIERERTLQTQLYYSNLQYELTLLAPVVYITMGGIWALFILGFTVLCLAYGRFWTHPPTSGDQHAQSPYSMGRPDHTHAYPDYADYPYTYHSQN